MWSNFHTHSNFCDGKSTIEEQIAKAKSISMKSLGLSSHAPIPFDCKWCMKKEQLDEYVDTILQAKAKNQNLEIYAGLEVDYIPGFVSPRDFESKLDYTIGSVHFVEKHDDGTPWEIDGPHHSFLNGFEKIFRSNIKEVIVRYFELTREMVEKSNPTIIGHLDKIKIQNIDNKFFDESDGWYQSEIKKTVDVIAKFGGIVEVNTRGIYQKKSSSTYPSPWVLELLHDKNIPVTISSDAHHADDLINQFPETAFLLKKIGFNKITILSDNTWIPYTFNENGIVF
jgi:histidinol-phosphatase (PHP family)